MSRHWAIKKNQLRYIGVDGNEVIPEASMVLKAREGKLAGFPSPSDDCPDLQFSNIAAELFLHISFNEENHVISISPAVRRGKKQFSLNLSLEELRDHVIIENTWRYISNYEDICPLLSDAGITSFGSINLQQ